MSHGARTSAVHALASLIARVLPGAQIIAVRALGNDDATVDGSHKGAGYGVPLAIEVQHAGEKKRLVLHTAASNQFGHDRRSDRAAEMLLAFDCFDRIPRHVRALEVGAYTRDGGLMSLAEASEFYLLTSFADGEPYAHDLREIAKRGSATDTDVQRARELARYLSKLHGEHHTNEVAWRRATRDLFGSGEGLFGILDSYPDDTPSAPADRLQRIEHAALTYRPRLRASAHRLSTTHGDFHPFNLIFSRDGVLSVLDASRGCLGDPADDVTCLAVNYPFFALSAPASSKRAYEGLWNAFLTEYFSNRRDADLFSYAPPYLAWRALVLANPIWYPDLPASARDQLLSFVERALERGHLDPDDATALFR